MSKPEKACLIYVRTMEEERQRVHVELEQAGYTVCEVMTTTDIARAAQNNSNEIPDAASKCIAGAKLCIFLIPEDPTNDIWITTAVGLANQLGKRVIGILEGARTEHPIGFDAAAGMLRQNSERVKEVICGEDLWEDNNRSVIKDRDIKHIRCQ